MKKTLYIPVIAAFCAGFALTSCSDFLEAEDKKAGGQTAEGYFSSDATSLLTTAYSGLKSLSTEVALTDQGTDLYLNTRGHNGGEFNEYTLTAENGTVYNLFVNAYKVINYSNGVIKYAGADSKLGQEARFLRGYCYYMLVQQFGSVPYITSYIEGAERSYPRTAIADIYPALISDLTDIYNNSKLDEQNHSGRASKQAVAALLAKVTLSAGWDLDTDLTNAEDGTYSVKSTTNFTEAAQWAEKAINGVQLTMTFESKWAPSNEGNAEEIFSVQYDRAGYPGDVSDGGHSLQNNYGGYYGACSTTGLKNVGSDNQQSKKSMYLFEKGDTRYEATYMTTLYNAKVVNKVANWGTEGYYAFYNSSKLNELGIANRFFPYYTTPAEAEAEFEANKEQYIKGDYYNPPMAAILSNPVVKYTFDENGKWTKSTISVEDFNLLTNNGVCVRKYDDPESAQLAGSNDYRDIVLFHVSDMYLIAAEAYLMAGNESAALEKVNAVRARAGVSAVAFDSYSVAYSLPAGFKLNKLDVILDERARELYAERQRWMDLRRTKQLVRYNVAFNDYVASSAAMKNNKGEIKWYRPIPTSELNSNTALTTADQNPGY
ncbi:MULTISPECIES: RagB/SusD family nutrient uptake outer membrane protein [unclassified Bacteroides]|uniref:RagB/SusD family nutrient uptake outer membrane protein n=1 Tax=unclassified Bacteroides TaxID=2646097 RepID=UPI0009DD9E14|nr:MULTISPECIES: RagB/SusD family nutrient uptake outer membrane protein [unclassified Bacteroides]